MKREKMNKVNKSEILKKLCYTELVYARINKKLKTTYSNQEIEHLIFNAITEVDDTCFEKTGKNIYIYNSERNISITINSYTFRVITVDRK